jgi:hypothetical protein
MDAAAAARVEEVVHDSCEWGARGGMLDHREVRLAVRLLYEKARGDKSVWAAYLAVLPSDLGGSPLLWSAEEVNSLLSGRG